MENLIYTADPYSDTSERTPTQHNTTHKPHGSNESTAIIRCEVNQPPT